MKQKETAPALSRVLFFLKENPGEIPWLGELLSELEASGIQSLFAPFEGAALGEDRFVITDSDEGADFARATDCGYMAMAPGNESWLFQGAECVFEDFAEINADFVIKMFERFHDIPWTICRTERTIVREMTLDDLDDLYRIYAEEGITEYTGSLLEEREEERAFEKAYIETMYRFFGYGIWIVLDRETGEVIGRAGVTNRSGYEELELGYLLSKRYQHRGIAREVVAAVIDYARRALGCSRLNAFADERNLPSCHLLEDFGFVRCGRALIEGRELMRYLLEDCSCLPPF